MTAADLTDEQIRGARAARMIDRATFEAALHGYPEAKSAVAAAINERNRRQFVEDVTP